MRWAVICLLLLVALNGTAQYQFVKQWDRRFGGTRDDDFHYFIHTNDRGYLLGGSSFSDANGDKTQPRWGTSFSSGDYWLVKVDSSGNKEWDKRFGGNNNEALFKVRQTIDGGYILGGTSRSGISGDKTQPTFGDLDCWLVKIDSFGNKDWDNCYGGTGLDGFTDVIQTLDNGYIIAGYSNSPVSGNKSQPNWDSTLFHNDAWVVKTDVLGNKQWDRRFGGTDEDFFTSVIQTSTNGYVLSGFSSSGVNGDKTQPCWDTTNPLTSDAWLVGIDSLGNKQWDSRIGGVRDDYLWTSIIDVSSSSNYIVGGETKSEAGGNKSSEDLGYWIISIDSLGNKQWDIGFKGGDGISYIDKTIDNGYLISGTSSKNAGGDKTEDNIGGSQIWILKTDSAFNKQWDKTIFTNLYSEGYSLQVSDKCYTVGCFTRSGVGGYKSQPNWDSTNQTPDYWLMKFCMEEYNSVDQGQLTTDNSQMQIWPNPFNTDLSLTLSEGEGIIPTAAFTITTVTGQVVYQQQENSLAPGYTKMLDLSYLPNGVYFVEVSTAAGKAVQRVVKQ